jgi:hypothetical protein
MPGRGIPVASSVKTGAFCTIPRLHHPPPYPVTELLPLWVAGCHREARLVCLSARVGTAPDHSPFQSDTKGDTKAGDTEKQQATISVSD